jgi:hypothetical protein
MVIKTSNDFVSVQQSSTTLRRLLGLLLPGPSQQLKGAGVRDQDHSQKQDSDAARTISKREIRMLRKATLRTWKPHQQAS